MASIATCRKSDIKCVMAEKIIKIACFLLIIMVLSSFQTQLSVAQQVNNEQKQLAVYSVQSKRLLAELSGARHYSAESVNGDWSTIRFNKPVVPVWVSGDYGRMLNANTWLISGNRINLRDKPSLASTVLGNVSKGYQSRALDSENGFIKIYAPLNTVFAVKTSDLNRFAGSQLQTKESAAKPTLSSRWNMTNTSAKEGGQNISDNALLGESVTRNSVATENDKLEPLEKDSQIEQGQAVKTVQPQKVQALIQKVETPQTQQNYRLSPGDTISLVVFGEKDLSLSGIRIPQSGRVSFPLIGGVDVANLTIDQLEENLVQKLSQGYVRNPKLTVTIDSYRPIFVNGAVGSTGSFSYTEGLTVAKAIALAGGAKSSAKENGVTVTRQGSIVASDLKLDSELSIQSGDIISVENDIGVALDEPAFYVYLHGEVKRPGEYSFRRGLTVEKAVVLAGGFTLRASRKRISVSRIVEGQQQPKKIKKVPLYMPVEPGDIIDVGASWF